MIDEIDALVGDTLISVLRQIRAGYAQRPGSFAQSVIHLSRQETLDLWRQHEQTRGSRLILRSGVPVSG